MDLLRSLIRKSDVLSEYPALVRFYEEIVSNNPNISVQDNEGMFMDDLFLKRHSMYDSDFFNSLERTFLLISQEKPRLDDLIFKMRQIEKKLQKKLCNFAVQKSKVIHNLSPELGVLEQLSFSASEKIKKLQDDLLSQFLKAENINKQIRKKLARKNRMILYLEMIKKRFIVQFVIAPQKFEEFNYLGNLLFQVRKFHKLEYLLPSQVLDFKLVKLKDKVISYWVALVTNGDSKMLYKFIPFLKDLRKCYHFRSLEELSADFFDQAVRFQVVRNIRISLFNEEVEIQPNSLQFYLKDFFKLEILLPMMTANNLSPFLNELLRGFSTLFTSIDNMIYEIYRIKIYKKSSIIESLLSILFSQKIVIVNYISTILRDVLTSINLKEMGEIGLSSFLSFILNYENFLYSLRSFSCHFPTVPSNLIFGLINDYLKIFREKTIRDIFHEFLDEDFSPLKFSEMALQNKILRNLQSTDDRLKLSREIAKNPEEFKKQILNTVLLHSYNDFEKLYPDAPRLISLPNSTPAHSRKESEKVMCRSAMTMITVLTNYSKLLAMFPEYQDFLLEDCSLFVNIWVFACFVAIIPLHWIKNLVNFEKENIKPEPELSATETHHDNLVFKFHFREIRRLFFHFICQLSNDKENIPLYLKHFVKKIVKEDSPKLSIKQFLITLQSIDLVFRAYNLLDGSDTTLYSLELSQAIKRFLLQFYFLERFKGRPCFEKILQYKWSTTQEVVSTAKNVYFSSFLSLFNEVRSELFSKDLEDLKLDESVLREYLFHVYDMLMMLLIEIFSQILDCNTLGRFQMKHDFIEILKTFDQQLAESQIEELKQKYSDFIDASFYNSSKDIYEFIMKRSFFVFSFRISKVLLVWNSKSDRNSSSSSKIVLTEEEKKILNYCCRKIHERIREEIKEEDFLSFNPLMDIVEERHEPPIEEKNIFFRFIGRDAS